MINDADIPPPEAVIATLYVSLDVFSRVETMKNAVLKPPEVSVTELGLVEKDGGWFEVGLNIIVSATTPEKPFRLAIVIVEFPVFPFEIVISPRLFDDYADQRLRLRQVRAGIQDELQRQGTIG